MEKINSIIFSKDRAMQLHLLLESLEKNSKDIFEISVLYKSTSEEFENGYLKVKEKFPYVNFVPESEKEFKKQTLELLNRGLKYSCFFTDDDIIYNSINQEQIITTLENDQDVFCFSLRLGKNTTNCYTMRANNVIVLLSEENDIVKWDWTKHYMDFGYPLSVDGHIFRTKDILKLSNLVSYQNPNTFEASLQIFDNYPKSKMAAFSESKLVNSPVNIVQNVFENRKAEEYNYSTKELNDMFLSNKKIDYNQINFNNIIGCHQELEFKFL